MSLDEDRPPFSLELDAAPGPARPLDDFALERLVQTSVSAWEDSRPRSRPFLRLAAVAAMVLLGLPAGSWAAVTAWRAAADALRSASGRIAPSAAPTASEPTPLEPTPEENASIPSVGPAPTALEADEARSRELEQRPRPARGRRTQRRPRPAPAPRSAQVGNPGPAGYGSAATERPPSLARASRLRRQGAWRRAAEMYAALRRAGEPSVAHVAAVAEGQLRLEHLGQPEAALRAFRAAQLALPKGPLVAEALLGEGDAEAGSGRIDSARRAWTTVLRRFPGTSPAQAAERRLAAAEESRSR